MIPMEEIIRGSIEMNLDIFLNENTLQSRATYYNELKKIGLCNSLADVLFGALVCTLTLSLASLEIESSPTEIADRMQLILDIVRNRSLEIQSKILKASSL